MIQLDIDKKIITLAMVPYIPNDAVIEMATGLNGDYDKVKIMVQLQIMDKDMNVETSALMSIDELKTLLHLGRAVGMSIDAMSDTLDQKFEEYRKSVREKSKK